MKINEEELLEKVRLYNLLNDELHSMNDKEKSDYVRNISEKEKVYTIKDPHGHIVGIANENGTVSLSKYIDNEECKQCDYFDSLTDECDINYNCNIARAEKEQEEKCKNTNCRECDERYSCDKLRPNINNLITKEEVNKVLKDFDSTSENIKYFIDGFKAGREEGIMVGYDSGVSALKQSLVDKFTSFIDNAIEEI